jgi:hypothetical protein
MTYFEAASSAVTKPAQAQLMSNVPAFFAPSRCWTTTEVAGEMYSGVSVARTMRSNSSAPTRAASSARRAAPVARSAVLSPSAQTWRSRMPSTFETNSSTSSPSARLNSALVTTFSGTNEPVPMMRAKVINGLWGQRVKGEEENARLCLYLLPSSPFNPFPLLL